MKGELDSEPLFGAQDGGLAVSYAFLTIILTDRHILSFRVVSRMAIPVALKR